MQIFKDKSGGEWVIEITCGHRNVLQARCDFDLFDTNTGWLSQLQLDIDRMLSAIYYLVEPQVKERGLDELQWAMLIGAKEFADAQDAFLTELEDFFRNARRTFQMKAVQFVRERMATAFEEAGLRMDRAAPETDTKIRKLFADESGNGLESSDSTPDHSHSGNSSGRFEAGSNTTGRTLVNN